MPTTCVNGKPGELLSIYDRGLQFGDGVFETIAVQNGVALCLQAHLERLESGCRRLAIDMPERALLQHEAEDLCQGAAAATLKLIVTRGVGGRGYLPPDDCAATRALSLYPPPQYPPEHARAGIAVQVCRQRLARQPQLAGIKHLNRLEQILLRREAAAAACPEGVALDTQDNVVEGVMSNIFLVKDGVLCTPELSHCGILGVIRERIIELCKRDGRAVEIRTIQLAELLAADEVFYCNSLLGLWPVRRIVDVSLQDRAVGRSIREQLIDEQCIMAP